MAIACSQAPPQHFIAYCTVCAKAGEEPGNEATIRPALQHVAAITRAVSKSCLKSVAVIKLE